MLRAYGPLPSPWGKRAFGQSWLKREGHAEFTLSEVEGSWPIADATERVPPGQNRLRGKRRTGRVRPIYLDSPLTLRQAQGRLLILPLQGRGDRKRPPRGRITKIPS